jgi:L-ascorbate 6-phosphate lactonase
MSLAAALAAHHSAPDDLTFWWLGQQSYVVDLAGRRLYLDPYLDPHPARLVPPPLAPADLADATLVFGTHDHEDHIDRASWPAIARLAPRCRFVVPGLLVDRLVADLDIAAERFIAVEDGATVSVDDLEITGVAAAHEFLQPDPRTGQHPHLGFVIRADGRSLYHAGDTCVYEGLLTALRRLAPELLFLPINGRCAERYRRNCMGNMTWQEAVDLAGALRPRLAVPGHWDMFRGNTEDPQRFADYLAAKYPGVACRIPVLGERVTVEAP